MIRTWILVFMVFRLVHLTGQNYNYSWPLPDGWVKEIVPFPLKFAPSLYYKGVEEIHFLPGWKEGKDLEQRWSYLFFWLIESNEEIDTSRLADDLSVYFNGLAEWVQKNNKSVLIRKFESEVKVDRPGDQDKQYFSGTARILDVFFTNQPVSLNAKIRVIPIPGNNKTVIFHEFSPQPFDHPVWKLLDDHVQDFRYNE
jgi:hypothetical protein